MAKDNRPSNVRRFEWMVLVVIAVGVVNSILRHLFPILRYEGQDSWEFGTFYLALIQFLAIAFYLLLTHLVTRQKSVLAMWIIVILMGVGIARDIHSLISSQSFTILNWLDLSLLPIKVYMIYLLFSSQFSKWLTKRQGAKESRFGAFGTLSAIGATTVIVVCVLIYRQFTGGTFPSKILKEVAQQNLKETIASIEYYKQIHAIYPLNLEDLKETKFERGKAFLYDSSHGISVPMQMHQYQLQPDGQHYVLFDVGPDGVSGTADDIFPVIGADEAGHIGYVKAKGKIWEGITRHTVQEGNRRASCPSLVVPVAEMRNRLKL